MTEPPEDIHGSRLDRTDAGSSVIRGGLLRVGGHVLGSLAAVAASALVIRHLGVVDTGRFVTVMALVVIVGSISDLGLSAVGVREYTVRPRQEGHRLLRNLLGMRIALALGGVAIATAFAAAVGYTAAMLAGTVIAGLGMILFVVQQSLAIPLHVRLRFGWVAGLLLLYQVGVAVGYALLALSGAGLLAFFAVGIPVMLPILALTAVSGGRETRAIPAVDAPEWRRMLTRILPYSAAVVLAVLYFRVAQIMVSLLSSEVETGYFGVSFRVLESLTTVAPLLVSSALPILARAAHNDAARFAYVSGRLAETMIMAGVGLALVVALGAEFAIDLVAGAGFGPSVDVLRILAVALVGTFVIAARGYALLALDRLRAFLVSNAIALAVVGGAGIPLIQAHGALGAAIALTAAELSLAASYEVSLTGRRRELRLPLGFLPRVVCAAAIAVVPMLALDLPSLAAASVGAVLYLGALLVLGLVPVELRQALWPRRSAAGEGT